MNTRVEEIFEEEMKGDSSFQEKDSVWSLVFGRTTFTKIQMREAWDMGIKLGIEIGLRRASLQGQKLELMRNTTNKKHEEFLKKFYEKTNYYHRFIVGPM